MEGVTACRRHTFFFAVYSRKYSYNWNYQFSNNYRSDFILCRVRDDITAMRTMNTGLSDKHKVILIYAVLAVAVSAAYWRVFSNGFVNYDDPMYITDNKHIQEGFTWDGVVWAFKSGYAVNWHPVTWLSHMLDCQLFGLNPRGHHLTSLLLHIANTLLLFYVLRKMTGALWASAFAAAVFGLHPLHIQSVGWVSERKDVLSTLFWLLTLLSYIRYVQDRNFKRYLITISLFAVGLMAKPMLVTLPIVMLLLDYWPLKRFSIADCQLPIEKNPKSKIQNPKFAQSFWQLIIEKIPFFVLSVISSAITFFVQQQGGAVATFDKISPALRLCNIPMAYCAYIVKTIIPSGLMAYYPYNTNASILLIAAAVLFLAVISAGVIFLRRPYLIVGWLFFIITLVPVIGIIQVGGQSRADRYMYIPMIGLLIMIAWGLKEIAERVRLGRFILIPAAAVCLSALSIATWINVGYWKNTFTLFGHAIEVMPANHVALLYLGNTLIEQKNISGGIEYYKKSIEAAPGFADARFNLGLALFHDNKFDKALEQYNMVLNIKENYPRVHFYIANVLAKTGHTDAAARHYSIAIKNDPDDIEAYSNWAVMLAEKGQIEQAIEQYNKALAIKPDNADIHNNLGNALKNQGKLAQAAEHYQKALLLRPDFAQAQVSFADTLRMQGRLDAAIEHYRLALKADSNSSDACYGLGMAMSETNHPDQAVDWYLKAIELDGSNIFAHGQLGLVMARQGKIDEAINHIQIVLKARPNDAEMHCNLGIILEHQGKTDEAIEQYRRVLQIKPDNKKAGELLDAALAKQKK